MTDTEKNVLRNIPIGKENAISRKRLRFLTGYSDRRIRYAIANLRREYPILSTSQDTAGYWLPTDDEEGLQQTRAFINEQSSRARACFSGLKGALEFRNSYDMENVTVYDLLEKKRA